jgi:hypothetical protein
VSNIQSNFNSILSTLGILGSLSPQVKENREKQQTLKNIENEEIYIEKANG